jgi:hypothetical protein
MHLPIIAVEGSDLQVFRSIEEAESYLEPVDVIAGEWTIFDATGQVLVASVVPSPGMLGVDRVRLQEGSTRDQLALEKALRGFVRAIGRETVDPLIPLDALVERVASMQWE